MKFKSIYISAFGAIKDYNLDLSDGLQVIFGENEAGKTTLCEFIKAMFYGSRKSAGMAMSAREKYAPFDGSPAGGRITFTHAGRDFVLERQFRKSDATDKVTLTDLLTGKSAAVAPDIGKELFGISLPAFERSVFIGNSPAFSPDENAKGELNQKLADTALVSEDSVSYKKILDRIDSARLKLISKSGKTGSLINDIAECNRLSEELAETDRMASKKQEITRAIRETGAKLAAAEEECGKAQAVLDKAKDIENTKKLKEYLDLKATLDSVTKELTLPDGTVADEMFLKKFEFAFSKLDALKVKEEATVAEKERLEKAALDRAGASPEEIREKISAEQGRLALSEEKAAGLKADIDKTNGEITGLEAELEKAKSAKKRLNLPLFIVGLVLLLAGAVAFLLKSGPGLPAAVCVAGLLAAALSFVIRPRDTAAYEKLKAKSDLLAASLSGKRAELSAVESEKSTAESKIESLNIALNFGVNDQQRIDETKERLTNEQNQIKEEKAKVIKFFSLPEDTDLDALKKQVEALSEKAEEQKQIKLRLSFLSRDLGGISYEEASEKLVSCGDKTADFDLEKQKELLGGLLEKKNNLQTLKTQLETELKTGFRNMKNPEDLRREIAALKEKIAAKQEFFDAATTAYSVLEESFTAARKNFGSALEGETLKNFKALTEGAYGAINVSSDFGVSAERADRFGTMSAEQLSRGTRDQAYLALRLAVSKLITEKEPLPIILDDSLSQYDDKRFLSALKFLRDYGKDCQLCLFTCHNFVRQAAEENGITAVDL